MLAGFPQAQIGPPSSHLFLKAVHTYKRGRSANSRTQRAQPKVQTGAYPAQGHSEGHRWPDWLAVPTGDGQNGTEGWMEPDRLETREERKHNTAGNKDKKNTFPIKATSTKSTLLCSKPHIHFGRDHGKLAGRMLDCNSNCYVNFFLICCCKMKQT